MADNGANKGGNPPGGTVKPKGAAPLSTGDIERLAAYTDGDLERAVRRWRRDAPEGLRGLLDVPKAE
jgi:hypothetical protein